MITGTPFEPITPPDSGTFKRRVALTFDDGPDPVTTPKVLDTLRRRGLKATFFVHGERIPGNEALVLRMVREGHLVGNHAERHARLVDADDALASCRATWDRLEPLVLPGAVRWFRFPGGAASLASRQAVESLGHCVVGWHVDSADWCFDSPTGGRGVCDARTFRWVDDDLRDDLPGNVLAQARAFGGGIALMHDNRGYTADTLDEVITALAFGGFGFTTLLDAEAFPKLVSRARALARAVAPRVS